MKITGKLTAYMTEYCGLRPDDFKSPTAEILGKLTYHTPDCVPDEWTIAGEAEVTLTLAGADALVSNKVAALRATLQRVRADNYVKESHLEDQISKLLAIGCDAVTEPAVIFAPAADDIQF